MSRWIQPSAENPAFEWLAFFLFLLLLSVCLLGFVVWLKTKRPGTRHKRKRKHRHHRHHHASSLPPLAGPPRAASETRTQPAARNVNLPHCRALTKKSASNLALAFIMLPRQKRDAMAALYAFCRAVDDLADEDAAPVADRREQLAAWREDIRAACENRPPRFVLNQEFQPVIQQFQLPFNLFDELIQGCEMDLEKLRYETYDELELYCYRVASVVGLLSIQIFGHQHAACKDYAIYLGQALQFTNILRDVKNDAARGRIYLPQSELKQFRVPEAEILGAQYSDRYRALAASVAGRARGFYRQARQTLPPEDRQHGGRRTHGHVFIGGCCKSWSAATSTSSARRSN